MTGNEYLEGLKSNWDNTVHPGFNLVNGLELEYIDNKNWKDEDIIKAYEEGQKDLILTETLNGELEKEFFRLRWHNLITNPNDLPSIDKDVILKVDVDGLGELKTIGWLTDNPDLIKSQGTKWLSNLTELNPTCTIFAWKEIE